ncbi:DUF2269 family protein [Microbacterium terrisoli]|jgi:uncharacterized membrane protein|uniref:DUF2269 family protein n=1 Tax=Microbacterium terrisoli TaxID=3242192 RepID=UPI002803C86D|nr:DUF2269 family protein [Microbacterium protaetiae]
MGTVMIILHVITAVFIVGPMAVIPMTGLRTLRSGNASAVRSLAKSTAIFSWLSLITFVIGFGVAGAWKISIGTPWILWSIIAYVIAFVLSVFVVAPQLNKAAGQVDGAAEGTKPAGYGVITASSGIASLLLLVVVLLMVWH